MQDFLATLVGKSVRLGLSFRPNGGHALPGLVIEKIFPGYVAAMLKKLPGGVVVITGTNGKTTTTKIVTQILRANGKKVITNSTGSNLVRGIASSLSRHASISGKLTYHIAVLEVDEATARALVAQVRPRWVVALNVSRDQLDRFGEVDTIAGYIGAAMQQASEGIITNSREPSLLDQAQAATKQNSIKLRLFGASKLLAKFFPTDYELAAVNHSVKDREKHNLTEVAVELADFSENHVKYKIDARPYQAKLKLSGQHNYLNGAAALALCRELLPDAPAQSLVDDLSMVRLAFGRGEKYKMKNGAEIELVLVKNPASFTQALSSYSKRDTNLMIAINDNIADGRDVSWLWDVNFLPLSGQEACITSGRRAADIALRLSYDDIKTKNIEPKLPIALKMLSQQTGEKVILATYTAMLPLYDMLSSQGNRVE
jgi:UDP-N-acetylmuramyl tripeptide synthase